MRLLANVLPQVRRLVPSAERGLTFGLVVFLVALELLGRQATSDVYDAVAGLALMSVAMFVVAWHRRYPLPWLAWTNRLAARLAARAERLKYEIGIDFRGTPPIPRRAPWGLTAAIAGLAVWAGIAIAAWATFPDGWRELGVHTSYVLYLTVLMALWTALGACALAGVYLPVWIVDQRLKVSGSADGQGVDAVALVGYGLLAVLVAWVTPPVYAVGMCLVVALAAGAWYAAPHPAAAAVLWRSGPGKPVYSVPMKRVIAGALMIGALVVFDLLLSAGGGRLTATPSLADPMPLTALLGSLTAWLVPGVVLVLGFQLYELRRTDPGRTTPPTGHITVGALSADRWRSNALVARWGWRARLSPEAREPGDVGVEIVPPEKSEATEFEPRWPLRVSVADLAVGAVRDRLERRDEIQLRRQFFRGLEKLLKQLKTATPSAGGGYWVAPHWWFIESVQWEDPTRPKTADDTEPLRPIGPAFDRVFPPRVRQHLYRVLRATQVDLIYLEDRIGHRKVEQVLRGLFEVFDVHGGRKKAEDHHFKGVPKVRVMIHEYAPGNPFKAGEGYPEPKFDEVSRFRVLHVFKDRGDHEEPVEPPFDFSWEPAPALTV
jgi:hypothetical protein